MFDKIRMESCGCWKIKTGCMIVAIIFEIISMYQLWYVYKKHEIMLNSEDSLIIPKWLYTLSLCFSAIYVLFNTLLMIGIKKESRKLICPWLSINVFILSLIYILTIISVIGIFMPSYSLMSLLLFCVLANISALYSFCILPVWSYYVGLDDSLGPSMIPVHDIYMVEHLPRGFV